MIEVSRYLLPNGLRMLHHFDNSTQMVALNIIFDVGSKDEEPSRTGFAHLFEHLMFGGSIFLILTLLCRKPEGKTMLGQVTILLIIIV